MKRFMDIKQAATQINPATKTSRRSFCPATEPYARCIVQYSLVRIASGAVERWIREMVLPMDRASRQPAILDRSPREYLTRLLRFAIPKCASFILLAGRGDGNRMISACRQWVRLSPRIPQPSSRKIFRGSNQRISPDSALPLCRALHPIALAGAPRGLDGIAKIGQKALLPPLFVVSSPPAPRALPPCRLPCASALPVSAPLAPRSSPCSVGRPRRWRAGPAGKSRLLEYRPATRPSSEGSILPASPGSTMAWL
jgi:hypothetical protein